MKTLHVDTGREMRGGQWQVIYLIERLRDATLLAPEDSGLFLEACKRGLDVRPLSFSALVGMARGFDLVHAHDARAHTMAAAIPGIRLTVSRGVGFPVKRGVLSRLKYSRARLFLAVSQFVAGRLQEAGVPADKIRVVYDGVPLVEPAHGNNIVALASKRSDLIRAAGDTSGIPIHFVTDLWQDLATARVFLYASEMEGLGSAALAAMSAGVAVIASRVGGLPEAVEHERTGLVVDNHPQEFAGALQRLHTAPELAAQMGRLGRQRVETKFTADIMTERTRAAYHEVLEC
jgi:glycosyl transferase family 1/glycosyl transferase family 4